MIHGMYHFKKLTNHPSCPKLFGAKNTSFASSAAKFLTIKRADIWYYIRMRKIVVLSFVSLDGVMQAPGGQEEDTSGGFEYGGWTVPYSDEFSGNIIGKQISMPFDLLLGRETYDIFAAYWPKQDPAGMVAAPFKKATKYVVSASSPKLTWEKSVLINGDVVAKLKELKQQDGPMLQVHGSSNLIQTLLKNDLVDELWLKIFPVTLGSGKRLFGDWAIPAAFKLTESKTSPTGVIFANYKRSGEVKTGSFV
jgi:dihydrofolate reductase